MTASSNSSRNNLTTNTNMTQKNEETSALMERPPQGQEQAPLVTASDLEMTVFNPKVFESLYRIAETLAQSSLVPESLLGDKSGEYPLEKKVANCMLVTEQAHRWGMSPFAVIGCASVVYGRLMWEGKLIHAVIEAKTGVRLRYDYNEEKGDKFGVTVSGILSGEEEPRTVFGTVGQWKTTANGSPWSNPLDHPRQLRYRGAREWARAHSPGCILGIITDDEELKFDRMKRAEAVAPKTRRDIADPFEGQRKALPQNVKKPKEAEKKAEPVKESKAKSAESAEQEPDLSDYIGCYIVEVEHKEGETNGRAWNRYRVKVVADGSDWVATTFSSSLGQKAQFFEGEDKEVLIKQETTEKGIKLLDIYAPVSSSGEEEIV